MNLNNYILQDKIGTGSFSKVYRIKEKQTNETYAAKISINLIDETTKDIFYDISREVNILSQINHPSILRFILYSPINFKGKFKPVIITEYSPNGSLRRIIDHDIANPNICFLTDTRKLIIIYGIASAMAYLHSHNILHRDLRSTFHRFLFRKSITFSKNFDRKRLNFKKTITRYKIVTRHILKIQYI